MIDIQQDMEIEYIKIHHPDLHVHSQHLHIQDQSRMGDKTRIKIIFWNNCQIELLTLGRDLLVPLDP